MSSAGRCIARSTSSGMVVGPGMARNSRPARTVMRGFPYSWSRPWMQPMARNFKAFASRFERIGYASPDLVLPFGCKRAGDDGDGLCRPLARLGKAQDPDLSVGII